jgi:hypothetical protein
MSNQPFNNDTDQQTRRQILKDTYLSRAAADADMIGGRFKKQTETRVTGVPHYPRQPTSSHWHSDPVPPEDPLGYSVDWLGGESPAPVLSASAVETTNATSDGGTALPPKGRDSPNPPVSARSFSRRV